MLFIYICIYLFVYCVFVSLSIHWGPALEAHPRRGQASAAQPQRKQALGGPCFPTETQVWESPKHPSFQESIEFYTQQMIRQKQKSKTKQKP